MTEDNTSPTDRKRVLIVDDDAEIVETVRYALQAAGYDVSVARDGNQGLAMAETLDPDLLILDMMMPKRSGFLVLEKIRRSDSDVVPVIMITANEGSRHQSSHIVWRHGLGTPRLWCRRGPRCRVGCFACRRGE